MRIRSVWKLDIEQIFFAVGITYSGLASAPVVWFYRYVLVRKAVYNTHSGHGKSDALSG